jgi:NADH-quinone oxidoreductase subunit M
VTEFHLPWLELAFCILLAGAMLVHWVSSPERARLFSLIVLGSGILLNLGAWIDFESMQALQAHDRWDFFHAWFGIDLLSMDEFSAPLLLLTNLHSFLTVLSTLRTKVKRLPFAGVMMSQALVQGMFSTEEPGLLIGLMGLSILPAWRELVRRGKPTRVFLIHMGIHYLSLVLGWLLVSTQEEMSLVYLFGGVLLVVSILIRSGVAPMHCWVPDFFEHASFGSAILFVTPMVAAYAAVRLVMPVAPGWGLQLMAFVSVLSSVYAAGMAWVQQESRRFYSYLFLSHASMVLVGLETITTEALTGALCVWFSASLSLTGFGLTLRAVESRLGRLSLSDYHGLYEHMPNLAVLFLITGLASVGFPGTIGFVSTELLVDGVIHEYPFFGLALVFASALNGVSIVQVYFRLFTGTKHTSSISLQSRWPERMAVLTLVVFMIGGGLYPQPFLASRTRAAEHLIEARHDTVRDADATPPVLEQSDLEGETANEDDGRDAQRSGAGRERSRDEVEHRLGSMHEIGKPWKQKRGPHRNRDAIDQGERLLAPKNRIPFATTLRKSPHEYPALRYCSPIPFDPERES